MRSILAIILLALTASSASAQHEAMSDLSRQVQEFNDKSSKAIKEYRRTGDYRRYKQRMEPLLDDELPQIIERIRSSMPQR
jgi:predicted  nucleic acid-binding Zn-ribbon protein